MTSAYLRRSCKTPDCIDKLTIAVKIPTSDGNASLTRLVGIGSASLDLLNDLLHILTGQHLEGSILW